MSEFRQDPVSGEWIIIAAERVKRPHDILRKKKKRVVGLKAKCPFENLEKSGNWPPYFTRPDSKAWRVAAIPNKYPALIHRNTCSEVFRAGPYRLAQGIGHSDLIINRGHEAHLANISEKEAAEVLTAIQIRYRELAKDECLEYATAFLNYGPSAGASLAHPHYQLFGLPIIPPEIQHSLHGSGVYYAKNKKCIYCEVVKYELKEGLRILDANEHALAFTPFASVSPFEVRVLPRRHRPALEHTPAAEIAGVAAILRNTLRRIKKYLHDPDLNFFIHSIPLRNQSGYRHYHWHIEIFPKDVIAPPGGLELGTRVQINVVDPDKAAAILLGQ